MKHQFRNAEKQALPGEREKYSLCVCVCSLHSLIAVVSKNQQQQWQ